MIPRRFIPLGAALGIGLICSAPANALNYTAFDLGTLGGSWSIARGLNAIGQVVGSSGTADYPEGHAFITGANGVGMTDLGSNGYPVGINSAGQVVQNSTAKGTGDPFITGANGAAVIGLGSLGGLWRYAHGINDAGQVVGESAPSGAGAWHAFITGSDGVGMFDLGTFGGSPDSGSIARGVNAAGQATGSANTTSGALHAFITDGNGIGMTDLGTLGGASSSAYGINAAGQVVGISTTLDGWLGHAFITGPNGVGMTDLGTLGGTYSIAFGINAIGQVVGESYTTDNAALHAFVTGANGVGMIDLNDLIAGNSFNDASAINDRGQIIASGALGHAYLISTIPEPETYGLTLVALGLLGFFAQRKQVRNVMPG